MDVDAGCPVCRAVRGDAPPPGGTIYTDGRWWAAHAPTPPAPPGRLLLTPVRHVVSLADLSESEAAALGPLLVRLVAALAAETGAARVDVTSLAGLPADEGAHLCLHLVPARADLPPAAAANLARRVADRLRAHRERAG